MRKWLMTTLGVLAMVVTAERSSAQRGGGGGGGRPSFDMLLNVFDVNGDDALEVAEVPPMLWNRLSLADANGDGIVTEAEFNAYSGSGRQGRRRR